jgi:hypothetical protein
MGLKRPSERGVGDSQMREFVIERTNEMKREWWTGSNWTENEHEARWYPEEPDAPN